MSDAEDWIISFIISLSVSAILDILTECFRCCTKNSKCKSNCKCCKLNFNEYENSNGNIINDKERESVNLKKYEFGI